VSAVLIRAMTCLKPLLHGALFLSAMVFGRAGSADAIVAEVSSDPSAHAFLVQLCDEFGGRLTGSSANAAAMDRLEEELLALGLKPERSSFTLLGWQRGEDRVERITPPRRRLRTAALAYSAAHDSFHAPVVNLGAGGPEQYEGETVDGCIGLIDPATPHSTRELVALAVERGIRGLLYLNRVNGGQLLARTSSFDGAQLPIPLYSITQEEGRWLQRLIALGQTPMVRIETKSAPRAVETANLMVRLPGETPETIVVGAHFDSWDLGQGALDNGLGIAQLYALAKALRRAKLRRSIELVWFNGEEQGLWGSRHQAALRRGTSIAVMINLDMVGVPIAVNALGDSDLVPVLQRWNASRGSSALERGVENTAWFGSDHVPYQLAGIRAVTFNAPIDPAVVRYYHDVADTADKVSSELVTQSAAVIASLVIALSEAEDLPVTPRDAEATRTLFQRFGLDRRMKAVGYQHSFD
jgi:Iap family predicted aminopeptidase